MFCSKNVLTDFWMSHSGDKLENYELGSWHRYFVSIFHCFCLWNWNILQWWFSLKTGKSFENKFSKKNYSPKYYTRNMNHLFTKKQLLILNLSLCLKPIPTFTHSIYPWYSLDFCNLAICREWRCESVTGCSSETGTQIHF